MLIKMLTVVFAGVFIGAAALEMKTDRHGKKKERRERDACSPDDLGDENTETETETEAESETETDSAAKD